MLTRDPTSLGGLEPPTFRLTAERANRLRHRDCSVLSEGAWLRFSIPTHLYRCLPVEGQYHRRNLNHGILKERSTLRNLQWSIKSRRPDLWFNKLTKHHQPAHNVIFYIRRSLTLNMTLACYLKTRTYVPGWA